jgi:endonuclease III
MEREILIQEEYLGDTFKMFVCCILLNQTNNRQVRPILKRVFELIPNPQASISCDQDVLACAIKTTGFQNIKARRIKQMSLKFMEIGGNVDRSNIMGIPGIGKYGRDSWEIFIKGNLDIETEDKKLSEYLRFFRSC